MWSRPEMMRTYENYAVKFVERASAYRIEMCARYLRDRIREKLSRSQKVGKQGRDAQGRWKRVGLEPSKPGEYPKKVTGHLRRNVNMEMDTAKRVARVGTNVKYGRYLEFGTRKMAARPWLSQGLSEFWSGMREILKTGVPPRV